jgi:hypothetical protein
MEAVVPATGIIEARGQRELRAPISGVAELGWYEGKLEPGVSRAPAEVRLDEIGNGCAEPGGDKICFIRAYRSDDGRAVTKDALRRHSLVAGDLLWPGQFLGRVRADELELRLQRLQGRAHDEEKRGGVTGETQAQLQQLKQLLGQARLAAPADGGPWMVVKVHLDPDASVKAGEVIATLVPVDPVTKEPRDLVAKMQIADPHCGELRPQQDVRLYMTMYNQRLYGHADARLERIEPLGEPGGHGERHFTALAGVTQTPFPLKLGAGFRAEIVVGRKRVYRIILER